MAKTETIHVRIDENVKNEALEIFNELGISVADAINMYFKQIILKKAIPFELNIERKVNNNFEKVSS